MKIEIWSDVVCPWCYIGKRRLERALEDFGAEPTIIWRSFELNPEGPKNSELPLDESLAKKYGTSVKKARSMMNKMTDTAREEGLELDFEKAQGGNTLDAHRLLHFAADNGVQGQMKERLFRAYMSEGRNIADRDELGELAGEVGLDTREVRKMLDTEQFVEDVRGDEYRARTLGVRGVPFFLIDDEIAISGAQPADSLLYELERARKE